MSYPNMEDEDYTTVTENREYEYEWQGTKNEHWPTLYVTARFDLVESSENGDGSTFEDFKLVQFSASFEGFGEENCLDRQNMSVSCFIGMKATCVPLKTVIGQFIYEQWRQE